MSKSIKDWCKDKQIFKYAIVGGELRGLGRQPIPNSPPSPEGAACE